MELGGNPSQKELEEFVDDLFRRSDEVVFLLFNRILEEIRDGTEDKD